ncbi:MAG: hypothetical protein NC043_00590, partial [Muribaculaceae bacterium]|nr:hypothetical protein [Muribaculaceae bacterium]
ALVLLLLSIAIRSMCSLSLLQARKVFLSTLPLISKSSAKLIQLFHSAKFIDVFLMNASSLFGRRPRWKTKLLSFAESSTAVEARALFLKSECKGKARFDTNQMF